MTKPNEDELDRLLEELLQVDPTEYQKREENIINQFRKEYPVEKVIIDWTTEDQVN